VLKDILRNSLMDSARAGRPATYKQLAGQLALEPPNTIRRVADALEQLIDEDAAAGRPLIAALAISKTRSGMPAPGFFLKVASLGLFAGDIDGPEARAFHARELERALSFYGRTTGFTEMQRY
jgi:hypothetical protein